ncbi:hypothetical protein QFC19_008711 [Naganishia cerealis]|uniref:Uncharacterized protein n=1 Tax=Naganishia cerealis TaxID=610337 RepID=A0ACC2UZI9_9TREE|nr:hypothetical protein QFC19_008711 [Naganishia cerealis]
MGKSSPPLPLPTIAHPSCPCSFFVRKHQQPVRCGQHGNVEQRVWCRCRSVQLANIAFPELTSRIPRLTATPNASAPAPAFSFGNPASATGSTTPQSKPPAPAFGFGAPASGSAPTTSLFGSAAPANSGAAAPASTGAPATGGFTGFSGFGAKPAQSSSLPGSGTTTPTTTTNLGGGGSLFGATSAAAPTGGFSFGAPATTQAPSTTTTTASTAPAQPSGSLFGGFGAAPASNTASSTGTTAAPTSLFGAKPAASNSGTTTPSLFGQPAPTTSTAPSLFGQPAAAKSTTPSLFGQPAPANSTTSAADGKTAPAFGQAAGGDKPATTSLFGAPAQGTKPTTSLFGASATGTSTPTSAPTMPSLFGKPADSAPAAAPSAADTTSTPKAAPPTFSLFGAAPTKTGTEASSIAAPTPAAAPSGGLFNFAKPAGDQSAAPSTGATPAPSTPSTQSPAGGLFAGFAAKPAEPTKDATAAASSTPKEAPKTGSLFSLSSATATAPAAASSAPVDDASKKADAPSAPKPAAASLFGNLGAPAAKPVGITPAIPSLLGATSISTTPATTAPNASNATAPSVPAPAATSTVSAAPEPAPSIVKGKTFNEIVERFEAELEDQVSRFKDQAAEVREWDMILIENSQNIARLYDQTQRAEVERHNIRAALDAIAARQDNLLDQVDEYESVANEVAEGIANNRNIEGGASRPADLQRQDAARLAVKLNDQMQDLGSSLSAMIAEMNKLTGNASGSLTFGTEEDSAGPQDSLSQITAILNAHVSSLEWINSNTETIEAKVGQLEKQMQDNQGASNGLGVSALGRSGIRRQGNSLLGASRYR